MVFGLIVDVIGVEVVAAEVLERVLSVVEVEVLMTFDACEIASEDEELLDMTTEVGSAVLGGGGGKTAAGSGGC